MRRLWLALKLTFATPIRGVCHHCGLYRRLGVVEPLTGVLTCRGCSGSG